MGSLSLKITINGKQQIHDTALLFMLVIIIVIKNPKKLEFLVKIGVKMPLSCFVDSNL